ncbi:MAG TPA: GIY-YIG nuclease family protein [Candidatus Saccharibacteria bacterium]|nr:GIY-YIG nuclease family protein [Candidatus Saccharibacteria bacterium]
MEKQELMSKQIIHATFSYGVIYVYSIPGDQHKGRLKIGSATLNSSAPTQEEIEVAAHQRIKQQTKTADISYRLEYATLGLTEDSEYLSDHTVHNVLIRSGLDRKSENTKNVHSEWFEIDLATAKSEKLISKAKISSEEAAKSSNTKNKTLKTSDGREVIL